MGVGRNNIIEYNSEIRTNEKKNFENLNRNLYKTISKIKYKHLQECLTIATTSIQPDADKLLSQLRCQTSYCFYGLELCLAFVIKKNLIQNIKLIFHFFILSNGILSETLNSIPSCTVARNSITSSNVTHRNKNAGPF